MSRTIVRFLFVGTVGFLIDAGLTMAISRLGASPVVARIPALAIAIVTTWLLNRRFTFDVRHERTMAEGLRYAAVALVTALLNFLCYSFLVKAGVWPPLAIAIATGCLMVFSFFGYRLVAFGKPAGAAGRQ